MIYQGRMLYPTGENYHHARFCLNVNTVLYVAPQGACISVHVMKRAEESIHTVLGLVVHVASVKIIDHTP